MPTARSSNVSEYTVTSEPPRVPLKNAVASPLLAAAGRQFSLSDTFVTVKGKGVAVTAMLAMLLLTSHSGILAVPRVISGV